jgi:hypothetical protein
MLGDDCWLILPKSQRPVRITATQRLLGEASVGDIRNDAVGRRLPRIGGRRGRCEADREGDLHARFTASGAQA